MLRSIAFTLIGLIALAGASHAAVLITINDNGRTATDVFDNQVYYHLEDGKLAMRMDLNTNTCSMFLHDQGVHVEGKCDEAQKEMEAAMAEMFKQQGIDQSQVAAMRKMMQPQRPAGADIQPAGSETVAGYKADCYRIGASRTMCVSEAVMALINREFSFQKMVEMRGPWRGGPFQSEPSEAEKAEHKLRAKGYLMKEVDRQGGMPGALQNLPEAVRKQIMAQMQQSGHKPTGRMVVNIEKNATFTPELPNYPKKSIREFASMMMRR